jgi:hypothetical protein
MLHLHRSCSSPPVFGTLAHTFLRVLAHALFLHTRTAMVPLVPLLPLLRLLRLLRYV